VITAPSTEELLLNCCHVLLDDVLPLVDDETVQAQVHMLDTVLRAAALRSAHEIAWMRDERDAMARFARTVAAFVPASAELESALAALSAEPGESLHLAEASADYRQASEAFSAALEDARRAGDEELKAAAVQLLDARVDHERAIRGGWQSNAGR
jgi:fructose-specific component phosphotransferase system IIB-like protein